jgi:hypothetical protein
MNRREFFFFTGERKNTAELSCETLYMRYLDSTLDGTTAELFQNIEQSLATVRTLYLTDAAWLKCEELSPMNSILAAFRERGGRVESK